MSLDIATGGRKSNGIKNFESSPELADRWIEGLADYIHPPSPSYLLHTTTHTILFHYYITNITSLMTKHIRYLSAHTRSTISFFASMSYQYHYKHQNTILTNQNQTHTPPQHNRHISLNSHCSLSNEAKGNHEGAGLRCNDHERTNACILSFLSFHQAWVTVDDETILAFLSQTGGGSCVFTMEWKWDDWIGGCI